MVDEHTAECKKYEELIAQGELDEDDIHYQISKDFSDPEYVATCYDEHKKNEQLREDCYKQIVNSSVVDYELFINAYKTFSNTGIRFYKGEYYIHHTFDTYFRCFDYGNEPIDNYDDLVKYLEPLADTMIHQYGQFDEDGSFQYFDDKNYTPKKGLTEELKTMLKFLYKDNDIFIEFG